ncbi:YrbL family protein [Thalassotalea nanhaiensis]|uniref:YrbL family protein n=1 Tax=Thalassotalea nanhaiensis TaxID=3065648 RepID=A0ABY9TGT0_9GAMM|nr:YrbL family protein [Colwelliaceae bacterium SQ345]
MITIDESLLIGKGAHRACYHHPSDDSLCIKVLFRQDINQKAIRREIEYYQRLKKRDVSFSMLSKYVEEVQTNMGRAHVYELICDANGDVSLSLDNYLESDEMSLQYQDIIMASLKKLKDYLFEQQILTLTLYPRNLVLKLTNEPKLVIIDDIGNTEYIRFSEMSSALAVKKVNRKWVRFIDHLQNQYPQNPLINKIKDLK